MALSTGAPAASADVPGPVARLLAQAGIPQDAFAYVVQNVAAGESTAWYRTEASMQPASTMKLVTTLVALETLGPAYRGKTQVLAEGAISHGTLRGNLVLRGLGDMDLDEQAMERMLSRVRMSGIDVIRGDLVIDRSHYAPARPDFGVPPFDESPEFRYNVIPDALMLNFNLLRLELASGDARVQARVSTALDGVRVESQLRVMDGLCDDWEDGWMSPEVRRDRGNVLTIILRGTFPKDCMATTEINVLDRTMFAERMFRAVWRGLGGRFHGAVREGVASPQARILAEHASRSLAEVVRDINKRSDNPMARMVYLAIGNAFPCDGCSTTAQAADVKIRSWFREHGIDPEGLVLENGSGLSRIERIRPVQLAAVLRHALSSRWAPEFVASLPIGSVDGSMRKRLGGMPADARARIKTGTLRDVSAVAGYVHDDWGKDHVVVAILNHPLAVREVGRPILDAFLEWVSRTNDRAAPALPIASEDAQEFGPDVLPVARIEMPPFARDALPAGQSHHASQ